MQVWVRVLGIARRPHRGVSCAPTTGLHLTRMPPGNNMYVLSRITAESSRPNLLCDGAYLAATLQRAENVRGTAGLSQVVRRPGNALWSGAVAALAIQGPWTACRGRPIQASGV